MAAFARFFVLLACFLGLGGYVAAADLSYNGIPPCAITCILQEIGHSSCSLTNQTCMCHDAVLAGYVQTCVMANCTVKEMLVAQNQSLAACGVPIAENDRIMEWFRALLFALPTFFFVFRMANKYMKLSTWEWDDTTIVIAYVLLAAFLPAAYKAEATGAGQDIWTLTPDQITEFLMLFFVFSMLYMTCLAAIKSSILFLYLRIFPDETFRIVLWCTQLLNLLFWIASIGVTFGSCQPMNYFWLGWTGEMKGKCINMNAFAMAHGIFNVALDVWMLVLPATQVYNLRLQRKRKLGVILMFSVGVFLAVVSAYRIKALLIFATSFNVTMDSFQSSLWSHIELCVGIFVACLPSTRQVWRIISPKFLEVTHISRSARSAKGSNNSSQGTRRTHSSGADQQRAVSYEESSIAHLVGDFNRIDLNELPSEPPTPSPPKTPNTPKTPKDQTETRIEVISGSSSKMR